MATVQVIPFGKTYSNTSITNETVTKHDWFLFEIKGGLPVLTIQVKGVSNRVRAGTVEGQTVYFVQVGVQQYKVLAPLAVNAVAMYWVSPEYQIYLNTACTNRHTLAVPYVPGSPSGTTASSYKYVYLGRTKNANMSKHAVDYVWAYNAAVPATVRFWVAGPTSAYDAYVSTTSYSYDLKLTNDAAWYSDAYKTAIKKAIAPPTTVAVLTDSPYCTGSTTGTMLKTSTPSPLTASTSAPAATTTTTASNDATAASTQVWYKNPLYVFIAFIVFVALGFFVKEYFWGGDAISGAKAPKYI
jgi:hypothetical protein